MSTITRVAAVLLLTVGLCASATAQDSSDWLTTPDFRSQQHAGLLGKRWVSGHYVRAMVDDLDMDPFNGFGVDLNLPLPLSDDSSPLLIDGFFRFQEFSQSSDYPFPIDDPPYVEVFELHVEARTWTGGVTIHGRTGSCYRPFIQFAGEYRDVLIRSASPSFGQFKDSESDTELLLTPGLEIDLTSRVALRGAVDIATSEFESSNASLGVIYWPWQRFFVRTAGFTTLEGDLYGLQVGGGLTF